MDSDPRDPRLVLARKLVGKDRVRPQLTGLSSSGSGTPQPTPQFNLPEGTVGQILVIVNVGGVDVVQFADPPIPIGGGGQYRSYIWEEDGSGGWDWVEETLSGQAFPVIDLFALE